MACFQKMSALEMKFFTNQVFPKETKAVPAHGLIFAYLKFARLPEVGKLRDRIMTVTGGFSRFTCIPDKKGDWHPAKNMDPEYHVVKEEVDDINQRRQELLEADLDLTKPVWQAHVLVDPAGEHLLLIRVQHCVADGFRLAKVLQALGEDEHGQPCTFLPEVRAIVLSGGECKMFCAGIDLEFLTTAVGNRDDDVGRIGYRLYDLVHMMQDACTALDECRKPVVCAINGKCLGVGVEVIAAGDMRLCTEDACFSIREAKMGLAPDLGALSRVPKICGNNSLVREACYTAKDFGSAEALQMGLVSRVYPNKDACLAAAFKLAEEIAALSPIAIATTKRTLNYCRDHDVSDGLDYVANANSAMLQSTDTMEAVSASMQKKKANFSKL